MSINSITVSGNVGRDMEVKETAGGKFIGNFSVAVKQGFGDHAKTSWMTVKVFGLLAQKIAPFILKGVKVCVNGEFVLEQWESQGVQKSMPVIIMRDFEIMSSGQDQQSRQQQAPQQQRQAPQQSQAPQQQQQPNYDDDIPF